MKNDHRAADDFLFDITVPMWFLLSILAVYILYSVFNMAQDSELAVGRFHEVISLIECLAAGTVSVTATGLIFELVNARLS